MAGPEIPALYYGVDHSIVTAIGRVAIAAGRVEWIADLVAASLNRDTRKASFTRTCKIIQALLALTPPEWSTVDNSAVHRWTVEALQAMRRRDEAFHAVLTLRLVEGGTAPVMRVLRTGQTRPVELAPIESVRTSLEELANRGFEFRRYMGAELRENVTVNPFMHWGKGDPQPIVEWDGTGEQPRRPSFDEFEAFAPKIRPAVDAYVAQPGQAQIPGDTLVALPS